MILILLTYSYISFCALTKERASINLKIKDNVIGE